jgi:ABC transport system ATP-binding/permease protein
VIRLDNIGKQHGRQILFMEASAAINRGEKVGLVGPNGSGKTTLLRLLLGELVPNAGSVRAGTGLEIAYFDQLRDQLDPDRTVFDSIADGADFVEVGGARKHVNGYLQDFLFPPDRARTPVRALSGGERNRLLLARLFTRAFNVLVLDEPTNDLDIETLDLLEDLLLEFSGTLLLVSHDRAFLDNVVTSTLVMEDDGRVGEYVGGYTDWVRQRPPRRSNAPAAPPPAPRPARRTEKRRRLSFSDRAELTALPDRIDRLEREREAVYASLGDPAMLRDGAAVVAAKQRVAALDGEIAQAMARWETLETMAAESEAS